MTVRIGCPNCKASLSMPDTMYGRQVKCPKCRQPFECPAGPTASAPAGASFDFDAPAAPVAAFAPEAGDAPAAYAGPNLPPHWARLRSALNLLSLGPLFYLVAFCVVPFVLLASNEAMQKPAGWLFWASWPSLLALSVLTLLFLMMGGGGLARAGGGSVSLAVLILVSAAAAAFVAVKVPGRKQEGYAPLPLDAIVSSGSPLLKVVDPRAPDKEFLRIEAAQVGALGAGFAAVVLFGLVLSRLALHLGNRFLAGNLNCWVALFVLQPFLLTLYPLILLMGSKPAEAPTSHPLRIPIVVLHGVLAVWLFLVLRGLRSAIVRAQLRGRL